MQLFATIVFLSLSVCMINSAVITKKDFKVPLFLGRGTGRRQDTVFGYDFADDEYLRRHESLRQWSVFGIKRGAVIGDNENDFRASKSMFRRKYCFESVIKTKSVQNWFDFPPTYSTVDDGYACSGTIELIDSTKIEITIEPDKAISCDKMVDANDAFIVCKLGDQEVSKVGGPINDGKYPLTIIYDGKDKVLKATIAYLTIAAFGMFTN